MDEPKVNQGVDSDDRGQLWRMHRRFFPDSPLRFCWAKIFVLTFAWMFLGLSLLYSPARRGLVSFIMRFSIVHESAPHAKKAAETN